jgi:hypothetical protein
LREYLDHPAHADLGMRLFKSADTVLAYDFNCTGPAGISALLK